MGNIPTATTQTPIQPLGLDHVVIRCESLKPMLAFYQEVLGLNLVRQLEDLGLYQLRAGTSLIDLVTVGSKLGGDTPPKPAHANMAHYCIRIRQANWPAILEWLQNHGAVAIDSTPQRRYGADGFGESIYVNDPEGNVVELKADPHI